MSEDKSRNINNFIVCLYMPLYQLQWVAADDIYNSMSPDVLQLVIH